MQDRIFIDSNVILYFFTDDIAKKEKVIDLFSQNPIISIQVINEVSNILIKKYKLAPIETKKEIEFLSEFVTLYLITINTVYKALDIRDKYKFSYFDSLIIASALENNCNVLYTEDMQDGQLIENKLKIVNPFKSIQQ